MATETVQCKYEYKTSTKENAWELRAERNNALGLSFLGILTEQVLQENWNVPPANEYLIINTYVAD